MTNRDIACILDRIADLLQIKDDNNFKIQVYRKAANAIYHLDEDIEILNQRGKVGDIVGVGKSVRSIIEELLEKGSSSYYDDLAKQVPPGLLNMLNLPGIGHKTVRMIYRHLGIDNLDNLLQAALDKKIRLLPGMGAKTEYNIIKGMELFKARQGKTTLGLALPLAEDFLAYILELPAVVKAGLAGSVKRRKPLVGDIDIVVATQDFAGTREDISRYKGIRSINEEKGSGENGEGFASGERFPVSPNYTPFPLSYCLQGTLNWGVKFEIILTAPDRYIETLVRATGSKSFHDALLGGEPVGSFTNCTSEEQVFACLKIPVIPAELRENRGEIEAARLGKLPELINANDIRGDLHLHSDWSDGAGKIEEMINTARSMNYSYVAITDHSKSLSISGGLDEHRLRAQGMVIDALNARYNDICIFKGIEVDILKDGRLDFDDKVLKELDVVVASIHSNFKLPIEKQTERILAAIKNEHVDILGHMTGRLLNRRSGYALDIEAIIEAAATEKIALEINSHPDRLDIDEEVAHQARNYGIKIAVNSDAHDREDMNLIKYGVMTARRGWLEKDDVINARSEQELVTYLTKY